MYYYAHTTALLTSTTNVTKYRLGVYADIRVMILF